MWWAHFDQIVKELIRFFQELPNELIDGFIGVKFKMYPLISKRSKGQVSFERTQNLPSG